MSSRRILCFGEFELDEAACELRRGGERVDLEPVLQRLLIYLIENRERVVSRTDLVRDVWKVKALSDDALYGALKCLRNALGDSAAQQQWIQTRPRQGYRFVGEVSTGLRESHADAAAVTPPQPARPIAYGAPRSPSLSFVGRSAELDALESLLRTEMRLSLQASIEGLAGIGKTELALQLVHRLAGDGTFPGGIFWLDAENPDLRHAWGTTLADQYGIPERPIERRCAELLRRIEEARAPVLVVLDNVASWSSVERPEPLPGGGHVHVLVTTRVRNLGGAQFKHLDVGTLEPPHDRALLASLAERDPEPGLTELLEYLDGHALALELAGAFLRTYPGETAASYLDALRQNGDAVEREVMDRVRYERTSAQALQAVWDRLPAATREAWRLASVFQAEPATRELAAAVGLDRQQLRSLDALHVVRSASDDRWSMHRLTRSFGRLSGGAEERATARDTYVRRCHALLLAQGTDRSRTFRLYVQDRTHFDAALELGEELWGEASRELMELRAEIGAARDSAGDLAGSRALLARVVSFCREALQAELRVRSPLEWAALQHRLGITLRVLGRRESGTRSLEEAERAFRAALEERLRERVPLDWAATLNELGCVLRVLGHHERGVQRLEEAVQAFRFALQERTREHTPLEWAATQHDLGGALESLGERESGTERLEAAVQAYRAALQEYPRQRVPLEWAAVQSSLGTALGMLGERESGTARLEEAVQAFRAALEERTRERVPLMWAMTQNSLANALCALGEREPGTERLSEAVRAYRAVLQEWTRERVPLDWAVTQNNLGNSLLLLAQREPSARLLEESVSACRAALQERTRERMPREWALTQNNLGNALCALGEMELSSARLEEAACAHRAALLELTRESAPVDWAATQYYLGNVLRRLGECEETPQRLQEAIACYRAALETCHRDPLPVAWALTQQALGVALWTLGRRQSDGPCLEPAAAALRKASEVWETSSMPWRVQAVNGDLAEIELEIRRRASPAPEQLREG